MPEFLDTKGAFAKIHDVIINARTNLMLISPYISSIPELTLVRVQDAIERRVDVTIICKEFDKLHPVEVDKLLSLRGLKILQNIKLHAKAYFNEREAVVTSLNLSGFSEQNNFEFGIYFKRDNDLEMHDRLVKETMIISKTSHFVSQTSNYASVSGYCIRCHVSIPFNADRPLCDSCFTVWNYYQDPFYRESFCHLCGRQAKSSKANPICDVC